MPVEWDQGQDAADAAGNGSRPQDDTSKTAIGRFLGLRGPTRWTATARKRTTPLPSCPGSRVLADNSGNLVDTIKNLQIFVTCTAGQQCPDRAVPGSPGQPDQRGRRQPSDLDAALTNLSAAVVDVQRFIAGSRNQTIEQLQHLSSITKNLADNQMVVKNLLHVAPNAIANA